MKKAVGLGRCQLWWFCGWVLGGVGMRSGVVGTGGGVGGHGGGGEREKKAKQEEVRFTH